MINTSLSLKTSSLPNTCTKTETPKWILFFPLPLPIIYFSLKVWLYITLEKRSGVKVRKSVVSPVSLPLKIQTKTQDSSSLPLTQPPFGQRGRNEISTWAGICPLFEQAWAQYISRPEIITSQAVLIIKAWAGELNLHYSRSEQEMCSSSL